MARRDEYAEPIRIVEEMRRKNGKPAADTNGHANGGRRPRVRRRHTSRPPKAGAHVPLGTFRP
jgi:hypothetical protein